MPYSIDLLPLKFFVNPGCPIVQAVAKAIETEVPLSEVAKDPMEVAVAEDQSML